MSTDKGKGMGSSGYLNSPGDGVADGDELGCTICLQTCRYPVSPPNCKHVFCFICLKGAALRNSQCPMCRSSIPSDFFQHHSRVFTPPKSNTAAGTSSSSNPSPPSPDNSSKVESTDRCDAVTTCLDDGEEQQQYDWFYEGRNGWWAYEERHSIEIETRYRQLSAQRLALRKEAAAEKSSVRSAAAESATSTRLPAAVSMSGQDQRRERQNQKSRQKSAVKNDTNEQPSSSTVDELGLVDHQSSVSCPLDSGNPPARSSNDQRNSDEAKGSSSSATPPQPPPKRLFSSQLDLLIAGQMYTIDLRSLIQFPRNAPSKVRRIKRELRERIGAAGQFKGVAGIKAVQPPPKRQTPPLPVSSLSAPTQAGSSTTPQRTAAAGDQPSSPVVNPRRRTSSPETERDDGEDPLAAPMRNLTVKDTTRRD